MNDRTKIVSMIKENHTEIAANLSDFWRRWADDLIAGGLPPDDVIETMVCVASVQVMRTRGATFAADALRKMAEGFQMAADNGCEFPAREH